MKRKYLYLSLAVVIAAFISHFIGVRYLGKAIQIMAELGTQDPCENCQAYLNSLGATSGIYSLFSRIFFYSFIPLFAMSYFKKEPTKHWLFLIGYVILFWLYNYS